MERIDFEKYDLHGEELLVAANAICPFTTQAPNK